MKVVAIRCHTISAVRVEALRGWRRRRRPPSTIRNRATHPDDDSLLALKSLTKASTDSPGASGHSPRIVAASRPRAAHQTTVCLGEPNSGPLLLPIT